MRAIKLDLEGAGFHVLLETEPEQWLLLTGTFPVNEAQADKILAHYEDKISETVHHSDFFGRLPDNCPGTII